MVTISKLKLNQLGRAELEARQMNALRGGVNACRCSCYYANSGGSSSNANMNANYENGYSSTSGCNQYSRVEYLPVLGYCSSCDANTTGPYEPF